MRSGLATRDARCLPLWLVKPSSRAVETRLPIVHTFAHTEDHIEVSPCVNPGASRPLPLPGLFQFERGPQSRPAQECRESTLEELHAIDILMDQAIRELSSGPPQAPIDTCSIPRYGKDESRNPSPDVTLHMRQFLETMDKVP